MLARRQDCFESCGIEIADHAGQKCRQAFCLYRRKRQLQDGMHAVSCDRGTALAVDNDWKAVDQDDPYFILDFQIRRNGEIQIQGKDLAHRTLQGRPGENLEHQIAAGALVGLDDNSAGILPEETKHRLP